MQENDPLSELHSPAIASRSGKLGLVVAQNVVAAGNSVIPG